MKLSLVALPALSSTSVIIVDAFSSVVKNRFSSTTRSSSCSPLFASSSTGTTSIQEQTASIETIKEEQPWISNPKYSDDYDQHRDWGFVYSSAPPDASASYTVTDIEGNIPTDLQGVTYYKIGGAKFEHGGQQYSHVLDGDGFVAAFSIGSEPNQVQYTGRFVETEYYQREQAANKILYRNVFGTQRRGGPFSNAFDLTLKNVANTNCLAWGGRLFALWEAGRPYELDPVTLETLPPTNNDGPFCHLGDLNCNLRGVTLDNGGPVDQLVRVGKFFTAHPHIVDHGETLVAFTAAQNAQKESIIMEFFEYNPQWQVKRRIKYEFSNGTAAPHDFAVGKDYFGFIQNRIEVDTLSYVLGLKCPAQMMQLQLKQNSLLHLVPRSNKDAKPMQVEIPPYFAIHSLAQLEENDGHVIMYSNGWDLKDETYFPKEKESVPFLGSWSGQYPNFDDNIVPPAKYYKTVVDRKTGKLLSHEEIVSGLVMEFPTQDECDPEICYMAASAVNGESLPGVGLAKLNTRTGMAEYWWADNKVFTGEVTPVAKLNGDKGSWLLGLIYDAAKKRTSLAILDSERFTDGPVARIHLPHHISYGLHSTYRREG